MNIEQVQLISFHMEYLWPPHHGKFMVCVGHRLQCKLANLTNHKFPAMGAMGVQSKVQ